MRHGGGRRDSSPSVVRVLTKEHEMRVWPSFVLRPQAEPRRCGNREGVNSDPRETGVEAGSATGWSG